MVPLLYGIAAVLVLWGMFKLADRLVRTRMLSRLRDNACPKCDATISTSSLRESGRLVETFGEQPCPLPCGSETFIELRCNSCGQTSTLTLRGDDVSVMIDDHHANRTVGLHA